MSLFHAVRDFFLRTTKHPLGFIGVNLTTLAGVLLLVLLVSSALGLQSNPYLGIVTFLILPGLFILGLLMIPIGSWLARRKAARHPERKEPFPVYDLNRPDVRSRMLLVGVLTATNLAILAIASYKGIEYMDSVEFCGATCHPVMKPEYTVYEISPHSRVRCVDCHIGPGASWFVRSKLSGTRQVFKQALGTWPRPVETPIENLRPSRDTCEQCHWPEKFHGEKLQVITHYQEDSTNTALKTVLLMKIGGGGPEQEGFGHGIHSHIYNRVYYRSDEERERIPWVRVERRDGTATEFVQGEVPDSIASRPMRLMDCIDCHNRPTHIYRLPARALDIALANAALPADLPYLKREALAAITETYPDRETAEPAIRSRVIDFYQANYPSLVESDGRKVEEAATAVASIWSTYVFPEMNVTWGTYPDHIGHTDFTGCFRCHDEEHVAEDGSTISQDCATCHSLLAMEEQDPEVLRTLFP